MTIKRKIKFLIYYLKNYREINGYYDYYIRHGCDFGCYGADEEADWLERTVFYYYAE